MAAADIMKAMGGFSGSVPPIAVGGAGPSRADAANYANITPAFDSSRWTVATGGSQAGASEGVGNSAMGMPMAWILIAGLVGLVLWKKL